MVSLSALLTTMATGLSVTSTGVANVGMNIASLIITTDDLSLNGRKGGTTGARTTVFPSWSDLFLQGRDGALTTIAGSSSKSG
jgi:hypothetical protein